MPLPKTALYTVLNFLIAAMNVADCKEPDWKGYAAKSDEWYRSEPGMQVARNVLSHQSPVGDWPKNGDTATDPYVGDRSKIRGTFDNGATVNEIRFLARAYQATGTRECRDGVLAAIDLIVKGQYPTGGWPQSSPPGKGYARFITFNDNTMVNLMTVMREVATSNRFEFVDHDRVGAAEKAFDAGINCILKCQVIVDGTKTVWCAQHDEVTLEPRPARSFELVSLSGAESVGILTLLMSLERPDARVVESVNAGVSWFEQVKLTGIRQSIVNEDKVIVADLNAPPLWARFSEIGTNRPFFSGRDGVKKYSLAEIETERRNGYAWYGNWGEELIKRHNRWKTRLKNPESR